MERICLICEKDFEQPQYHWNAKTCSPECGMALKLQTQSARQNAKANTARNGAEATDYYERVFTMLARSV